MGNWDCGEFIPCYCCCSFLLTLLQMCLPLWETVSHELLQHESFHGLQFFINCSSMGPLQGHKFCQEACSSVGFPKGHSLFHTATCSKGAAGGSLLPCGASWAAGAQPATPWSSWTAGESLHWYLQHLLPLLQWSLCLQSYISHTFSLLSLAATAAVEQLLALQKSYPEALPQSQMGSAPARSRSILEPASIGSVGYGEPFPHPLPLPKPGHINPTERTILFFRPTGKWLQRSNGLSRYQQVLSELLIYN